MHKTRRAAAAAAVAIDDVAASWQQRMQQIEWQAAAQVTSDAYRMTARCVYEINVTLEELS